jgi:hypothetical protein
VNRIIIIIIIIIIYNLSNNVTYSNNALLWNGRLELVITLFVETSGIVPP